jgi:hypothetical protein
MWYESYELRPLYQTPYWALDCNAQAHLILAVYDGGVGSTTQSIYAERARETGPLDGQRD